MNCYKAIKICNVFRKSLGHSFPKNNEPEIEEVKESNTITESEPTPPMNTFLGDYVILRSLLNNLIGYFSLKLSSSPLTLQKDEKVAEHFYKSLTLLTKLKNVKHALQLNKLLLKFTTLTTKEQRSIMSEIMFALTEILNSEYQFKDASDEGSEIYVHQNLPFHRPVWTCRVLDLVFEPEKTWTLSNFDASTFELENLMLTLIPNSILFYDEKSDFSLMDFRLTDEKRLFLEQERVVTAVRAAFKIDPEEECLDKAFQKMLENSEEESLMLSRLRSIFTKLSDLNFSSHSKLLTSGCRWILLGLIELLILSEGRIDPIRKKLIKINHLGDEVSNFLTLCK